MNFSKGIILLISAVLVLSYTACGKWCSDKKSSHPERDLPEFSLKDPDGRTFTRKDILKNGAVFVVTAPILSNRNDQEEWAKYLKAAKHKGKGRLIFLQDMSPSSFKETALKEMKKQSEPDIDPLLLIDQKGVMRRKIGVEKEDTIVLVYDKKGKCIHEEKGNPSQKSASLIWKSLE
jgi:hypothetical protein